jgi:hypothetical protein
MDDSADYRIRAQEQDMREWESAHNAEEEAAAEVERKRIEEAERIRVAQEVAAEAERIRLAEEERRRAEEEERRRIASENARKKEEARARVLERRLKTRGPPQVVIPETEEGRRRRAAEAKARAEEASKRLDHPVGGVENVGYEGVPESGGEDEWMGVPDDEPGKTTTTARVYTTSGTPTERRVELPDPPKKTVKKGKKGERLLPDIVSRQDFSDPISWTHPDP